MPGIIGCFWRRVSPRRHATAVWGHAGQDRGAALANAAGERLLDADFGGEGGMKG